MAIVFRRGSRGSEVEAIQTQLNADADINYSRHGRLVPDGIFGPRTKARVEEYQAMRGLAVDGIVGPNTWGRLFGYSRPFPGGGNIKRGKGQVGTVVTIVVSNVGQSLPTVIAGPSSVRLAKKSSLKASVNEVIEELEESGKGLERLVFLGNRGTWISPSSGSALSAILSAETELKELRDYWATPVPNLYVISTSGPQTFTSLHLDQWAQMNPGPTAPPIPVPYPTISIGPDQIAVNKLTGITQASVSCGYLVPGGGSWGGPFLRGHPGGVHTPANLTSVQGATNFHRAMDYAVSAINSL